MAFARPQVFSTLTTGDEVLKLDRLDPWEHVNQVENVATVEADPLGGLPDSRRPGGRFPESPT